MRVTQTRRAWRSLGSAAAVLVGVLVWMPCSLQAQTSLFDQPLSPATPPSALPPPEPGTPAPKPAPKASPRVVAPAPKPVAAPAAPVVAAPAVEAAPGTAPLAVAKTKPKAKPKPKTAAPGRLIGISNDSTNILTELEVAGDGEIVKLAAPLAPGEKTQLKLPVLKTCMVTVAATFASAGSAETSDYNICKDKTLRFTD